MPFSAIKDDDTADNTPVAHNFVTRIFSHIVQHLLKGIVTGRPADLNAGVNPCVVMEGANLQLDQSLSVGSSWLFKCNFNCCFSCFPKAGYSSDIPLFQI